MKKTPLIAASLASIAVILVILAVVYGLANGLGFLSIIGEEGYQPYDLLLPAGSYDATLWGVTDPSKVTSGTNSITLKGPDTTYQTRDLYLEDVRFTYSVGALANTGRKTHAYLDVPGAAPIELTACRYLGDGRYSCSSSGNIEVRWADYALGEYQVFQNGALVRSGTAQSFRLSFRTGRQTKTNSEQGAAVTITNPRTRALFSCDLQAGSVRVHDCAAGPGSIDLNDMPGFQSFCVNLPATITDAGVESSSKGIYYAWAQGESHPLPTRNDRVEWHYLADAKKQLGYPILSTGVVERCTGFDAVQDKKDIVRADPVVTDTTIRWTSSGERYGSWDRTVWTLKSGGEDLFKTSPPALSCAAGPTWSDPGCATITAAGKEFNPGQTIILNEYLSVTLEKLTLQARNKDVIEEMDYAADWRLDFDAEAVTTSIAAPSAVGLAQAAYADVKVTNRLPLTGTFIITTTTRDTIIGEYAFTNQTVTIKPGEERMLSIKLPTTRLGATEATTQAVLITDAGNIPFERSTGTSYDVQDGLTGTFYPSPPSFWERLWNWIKGWFA